MFLFGVLYKMKYFGLIHISEPICPFFFCVFFFFFFFFFFFLLLFYFCVLFCFFSNSYSKIKFTANIGLTCSFYNKVIFFYFI